ncbi:hypothetical protein QTL86_02950 [Cellulosilyticum sp. ST5]|uniref:hypothetical protein n=1 Tax=Cellulosilyticum sp. ST5 TaxID=3055805 RepID=UPI003977AB85
MCDRDISPNAVACSHCGEPMKKEEVVRKPVGYKVVLEGFKRKNKKDSYTLRNY